MRFSLELTERYQRQMAATCQNPVRNSMVPKHFFQLGEVAGLTDTVSEYLDFEMIIVAEYSRLNKINPSSG